MSKTAVLLTLLMPVAPLAARAGGAVETAACTAEPPHTTCIPSESGGTAEVVEAGSSCEWCGMSDCQDMSTCLATGPALAAIVAVAWTAPSVLDASGFPTRTLRGVPRPPIRPPPRA